MQRGITIGGTGERAVFKEKLPSVEECLERLKRHGGGLVSGANCLSKDTFAGKDKANKKKFKELEEKQARLYYDSVIKAFSMRFCKTVKEQEAVIQARIDEANARREKELLKEMKSKYKSK